MQIEQINWLSLKWLFIPAHGDCPYQLRWFVSDCHMQRLLDDQTDQAGNPESQTYGERHRKAWISVEGTFHFDVTTVKHSLSCKALTLTNILHKSCSVLDLTWTCDEHLLVFYTSCIYVKFSQIVDFWLFASTLKYTQPLSSLRKAMCGKSLW